MQTGHSLRAANTLGFHRQVDTETERVTAPTATWVPRPIRICDTNHSGSEGLPDDQDQDGWCALASLTAANTYGPEGLACSLCRVRDSPSKQIAVEPPVDGLN